jgi:hypothetical protein
MTPAEPVAAESALVDDALLVVEVARTIGAGKDAVSAADAFTRIDRDDASLLVDVGGA